MVRDRAPAARLGPVRSVPAKQEEEKEPSRVRRGGLDTRKERRRFVRQDLRRAWTAGAPAAASPGAQVTGN